MRPALLLSIGLAVLPVSGPASITLIEGRIYPHAQAAAAVEALAIDAEGRVLAVGKVRDVRAALPAAGTVERVRLQGTVVPGLIDAHAHLLGLGLALLEADLVDTADVPAIIERLRRHAANLPAEAWLTGRGWDQNDWPTTEFPTADLLDAAFPERPVWLERIDGHAGWANTLALERAGITAATPDPDGGAILRHPDGRPTGVLIDRAMELIERVRPQPDRALKRLALERAVTEAARSGLTGVHDAGMNWETLELLAELADAGRLPLRVYAMADGEGPTLDRLCAEGPYQHPSGRLGMRAVKLYVDGALGSRGAAMLADYSDRPGQRGLTLLDRARLTALVRRASDCGLQVATHAIGDAGNRLVLDAYATLDAATRARLRPRIEHAQVIAPADLPRFAELGVIASMQPTHATSDMPWAQARVGAERIRGAYAWKTLLDLGVPLALGSDFPVERVAPSLGLYAAISRQDLHGRPRGGWLPDQRLSRAQALHGFTLGAAHAAFAERELGSLEPGKRADFTVYAEDPLRTPLSRLPRLRVLGTWLDGRPVAHDSATP